MIYNANLIALAGNLINSATEKFAKYPTEVNINETINISITVSNNEHTIVFNK